MKLAFSECYLEVVSVTTTQSVPCDEVIPCHTSWLITINQQVRQRDVIVIKSVITFHAGQFYSLTEVCKWIKQFSIMEQCWVDRGTRDLGQGQCLPATEDLFAGQFKVQVVRHLQKHLLLLVDCFYLHDWFRYVWL